MSLRIPPYLRLHHYPDDMETQQAARKRP